MVASPILTRFYDPHAFRPIRVIQCDCDHNHRCIHVDVSPSDRDCGWRSGLRDLDGPVPERGNLFRSGLSRRRAAFLHGWLTPSIWSSFGRQPVCCFGPIAIFAAALFITLQSVCIRRQWFKPLAFYQVVRSALVVIFQLSLWVTWPNLYGLIIGQLLGQILALFVLARVWPFLWRHCPQRVIWRPCDTLQYLFSFRNLRSSTGRAQLAVRECPDLVVNGVFRRKRDETVLVGLPDTDLAKSGPSWRACAAFCSRN